MNTPNKFNPIAVDVVAGQDYWWCACGLSKTQPFCDGSHKTTAMQPQKFTAQRDDRLWFCTCKQTKNTPLCDGSHNKLAKPSQDKA
jgi:CDGSH iron-sulfur domain-containing protein 3